MVRSLSARGHPWHAVGPPPCQGFTRTQKTQRTRTAKKSQVAQRRYFSSSELASFPTAHFILKSRLFRGMFFISTLLLHPSPILLSLRTCFRMNSCVLPCRCFRSLHRGQCDLSPPDSRKVPQILAPHWCLLQTVWGNDITIARFASTTLPAV